MVDRNAHGLGVKLDLGLKLSSSLACHPTSLNFFFYFHVMEKLTAWRIVRRIE